MRNYKTCMTEVSIKTDLPTHNNGHHSVTVIEVPLRLNYDCDVEAKACGAALALQEFNRRLGKSKVTRLLLKKLGIEHLTSSDFYISDIILLGI